MSKELYRVDCGFIEAIGISGGVAVGIYGDV